MKKILIMFKNDLYRGILKDILISDGYSVVFDTHDMEEGIEKCKELNPHLIILDRDEFVPGEKYIPITLKAIRAFDKKVAIIKASTNSTDPRWIIETKKASASGVMLFPANPEQVLEVIKKYI